jgi:hypothetical protein
MPDLANLAQLCREAAAAAEAMGEWEADQLRVDLTATALEYLAGVG